MWRIWHIKSCEEAIDYAKKYGIEIYQLKQNYFQWMKIFGINLMMAVFWKILKYEAPDYIYEFIKCHKFVSKDDEVAKISFERGIPISVNDIKKCC